MKLLIVSATEKEIEPLLKKFGGKKNLHNLKIGKHLDILISGVGMVSTAYHCAKFFSMKKYDFAMNLGIAGSFKKQFKIGEVVNVVRDRFSELGAEDSEKFLSLKEMDLNGDVEFNNKTFIKNSVVANFKKVSGITVNTVHGSKSSIKKIVQRFNPDVETMEGAAFLYVCKNEKIPCAQIRTISNFVEERNKKKWNIHLAVKNLNKTALEIIESFV